MTRSVVMGGVAASLVLATLVATAPANPPLVSKAKSAGFPAKNCQYCHVATMPKKEAHDLNERGKFLVAEKEKQKAKEVSVEWLKDYPGGKEQK